MAHAATGRLLLVEDNLDVRSALVLLLTSVGWDVTASDGSRAVALAATLSPVVAVIAPPADPTCARDLVAAIHVPIVSLLNGEQFGVSGRRDVRFLEKPFAPEALLEVLIELVLGRARVDN